MKHFEGGSEAGESSLYVAWYPGRLDPWPPAARPAGACGSHTQHLLCEVCADSPAPRHRLFLAAVTAHYSHENKNSPCLLLPWDTAAGAGAASDPGIRPLTMHCLWSWVPSKGPRGMGAPPPVVLREARGLDQPRPEGCEVGTGVWEQAAFPGVPGMGLWSCAQSPCFANRGTRLEKPACWNRM